MQENLPGLYPIGRILPHDDCNWHIVHFDFGAVSGRRILPTVRYAARCRLPSLNHYDISVADLVMVQYIDIIDMRTVVYDFAYLPVQKEQKPN